jgi:hypothetical protein
MVHAQKGVLSFTQSVRGQLSGWHLSGWHLSGWQLSRGQLSEEQLSGGEELGQLSRAIVHMGNCPKGGNRPEKIVLELLYDTGIIVRSYEKLFHKDRATVIYFRHLLASLSLTASLRIEAVSPWP